MHTWGFREEKLYSLKGNSGNFILKHEEITEFQRVEILGTQ